MKDLTPVGLSKDGKRLVLIDAAGNEYAVPADNRLRAALRGDHARLGQLEMKMDSALRPRDIQARIRAGESAEAVATAAQTTVDKIMTYAGPVLAERAHIAQSAQSSSLRRRSTESSPGARTLADALRPSLSQLGLREDELEWDAWRREDGRWTLVADYAAADRPRHAEFTYDQAGRYVTADNDDAKMLSGELKAPSATPERSGSRRLSAVPDSQDELPLGDDAIEMVRDHPTEVAESPVADHADTDWIAATEPGQQAAGSADAADEADQVAEAEELVDGAAPVDEPTEPIGERRSKKKGRSSVPSWDEIMFGGGKAE